MHAAGLERGGATAACMLVCMSVCPVAVIYVRMCELYVCAESQLYKCKWQKCNGIVVVALPAWLLEICGVAKGGEGVRWPTVNNKSIMLTMRTCYKIEIKSTYIRMLPMVIAMQSALRLGRRRGGSSVSSWLAKK